MRCVCLRDPMLLFLLTWFGNTWLDSLFLSRGSCLPSIMWLLIYRETLNITRFKFYFAFQVLQSWDSISDSTTYIHLILGASNVIQYCVGLLSLFYATMWINLYCMYMVCSIIQDIPYTYGYCCCTILIWSYHIRY